MTRKKWQEVRDAQPETPERRAAREQARQNLEQEMTDYLELLETRVAEAVDTEAGLADVKKRVADEPES